MSDRDDITSERLREHLETAYPEGGEGSPIAVVRAPGRVNLIGEHTDYNEGFVLPVAIDLEVRLAVRRLEGSAVRVTRVDNDEAAALDLGELPAPGLGWFDYVVGTAWALQEAGLPRHAFEGVLASTLPMGAGLSSSAALEMATAWALSGTAGPGLAPLDLAKVAQRAENQHVGVMCGLMDQFASACGVAGHALLLDCRSTQWRAVPLPEALELVVIHSGVAHAHGDNEYNARRADCERAVEMLASQRSGLTSLRDADLGMIEADRHDLGERTYRRARHVITENQRVLDAVEALENGDDAALGELMAASHASMRDDYEITVPEIDLLVELAVSVPGVVGSRMTGGGFGGSTVSLVRPAAVPALRALIEREYPTRTGKQARLWTLRAVDGAGFVEV